MGIQTPGVDARNMALKRPGRYLIGLTGNIATGKSAVTDLLRERGARVIDADRVAHQVMGRDPVRKAIIAAFGPEIVRDGAIDRRSLGEIVFRDPVRLRQLEQIVHPEVAHEIDREIGASCQAVVVVEAIKLIESGLYRDCDAIWVVTSSPANQMERLAGMRGLSEGEARMRMDAQPPQSEKVARAHVVIDNNGSMDQLLRRVETEWARVKAALREENAGGA